MDYLENKGNDMKHVEMIIDYTTDGTDFQYSDNRGILTRCRDCKWADDSNGWCDNPFGLPEIKPDSYCCFAERKNLE